MHFFVTGGTGHVGAALIRRLVENGHLVAALVRDPLDIKLLEPLRNQLTLLDFHDGYSELVCKTLSEFKPDTTIHLAWGGVSGGSRNDPHCISTNISLSMETLDAARLAGCKSFIGIGSQAEYGPVVGSVAEIASESPVTGYGVAKFAVSKISEKYCELAGMRWAWVRLFATYGPGDDSSHFIPHIISNFVAGKSPDLTLCEQRWDYLYVEDAADAIALLAESNSTQGLFNLGSGVAVSLKEIVELVRSEIGVDITPRYGSLDYRPDQVMHLESNIAKIIHATGWKPKISLQAGLNKTIALFPHSKGN